MRQPDSEDELVSRKRRITEDFDDEQDKGFVTADEGGATPKRQLRRNKRRRYSEDRMDESEIEPEDKSQFDAVSDNEEVNDRGSESSGECIEKYR